MTYVYDDVTYVYDDVTYVHDDVTYVYDDVTYVYDDVMLQHCAELVQADVRKSNLCTWGSIVGALGC